MAGGSEQSTSLRKQAMIKALEQTLGVVKQACDMVGISRQSHYDWMKDDPEYKSAVDEIVEVMLDFLESKAVKLVNEGDTAMTIFMLKCRAKKRGYVERTEVEHSGAVAVNFKPAEGCEQMKDETS